jgi:hypothetical protein
MAADAIGLVGGVLGLGLDGLSVISGLKDALFPKAPATAFNNFQVRVGLVETFENDDQTDSRSLGGQAPALATWDGIGRFLNQVTPDRGEQIEEDTVKEYKIEGPQEADYLSVVRTGDNGICIALVSGKTNGGLEFMWTGDIGKQCGAPWYPQRNAIGQLPENRDYAPACVWIDGNADDNHIWRGFNFHLSSFPGSQGDPSTVTRARDLAKAWKGNLDLLCKSEPRFSMYEDIEIGNSIRYFNDNPSGPSDDPEVVKKVLGTDNWAWGEKVPTQKLPINTGGKIPTPKIQCLKDDPPECPPKGPSFNRDLQVLPNVLVPRSETSLQERQAATRVYVRKRQAIHADRLIITSLSYHSAVELCDSPYSLGPDMVSTLEDMFCDMSEKRLWPVCNYATASYCFDMTSQTVRGSDVSSLKNATTPLWSNSTIGSSSPGLAVSLLAGDSATTNPVVPLKSYTTVNSWGT